MADVSPTSSSRSDSAQRQADELRTEQESRLEKLRADQRKAEAEVRASGDAAISHIKKSVNENVDRARTDAEAKIKGEEDGILRNYQNLKKRNTQQAEVLEREATSADQAAKRSIRESKSQETHAIEQTQEQLRHFMETQNDLKTHVSNDTAKRLEQVQTEGDEKLTKITREGQERLSKTDALENSRLNDLKKNHQERYDSTRKEAQARLDELKLRDEKDIAAQRGNANKQIGDIQKKSSQTLTAEQRDFQRREDDLKHQSNAKIQDMRKTSEHTEAELMAEYSAEGQRIESSGQADINERQTKFDHLHKQQEQQNKKIADKTAMSLEQKEDILKKEHHEHVQDLGRHFDDEIVQQRNEFKKRFDLDHDVFKDSLSNQKEGYLREAYKERATQEAKADLALHREEDPFYRMKTFDAHLEENDDHYIVRAKVPPHEKNSVDVRVHDDKVVVAGRRAFQDSFDDEGVKTSTNSFQTYRQEFALPKPADSKHIVKTMTDEGHVTIYIPKKGFGNQTA